MIQLGRRGAIVGLVLGLGAGAVLHGRGGPAMGAEAPGRRVQESPDAARATLRVRARQRSPHAVPPEITGKFCEHLGANILNGMDAQILRNPTLAEFPFASGQTSPDGVVRFHADAARIADELRGRAERLGWPKEEVPRLAEAYGDGLAAFWTRAGDREAVRVSPDTGPFGGRAQRVEVRSAGVGIAQWTFLPLHRVRRLEFELSARSPDGVGLAVTLTPQGAPGPAASAPVAALGADWRTVRGVLDLPPPAPADAVYRLAVTAAGPGQVVLARVLLRPADHVGGADPDVIRLLKESRLPILRWPGGNFVSGYRWEDGVGPPERRPTRPNPAWGGVETNLFGTDEFIAFCRAVGCEPMICINAGDGTPEEAARWVEYCNGPASTPQGARRAAHGHPEPYGVRRWEIGNELWGRWQVHWTTASGYVDRYRAFARAMRAADPAVRLYACGAPVLWGRAWNDTLIAGLGPDLEVTTDHPLVGGSVPLASDPLDVYRDFMAVPDVLERKWADLAQAMARGGARRPRLAVTELQMFARLGAPAPAGTEARLTRETLVGPATLAEALYDVLLYHAAIRLAPFVEMVTHSATVNHGGGLRKERERVYANPCHHAQAAFAAFAGAVPVAVDLTVPMVRAPLVLPDLKGAAPDAAYGAVDALAAVATDGAMLLSLVHRGTAKPIRLAVDLDGFEAAGPAEVRTLTADVPWAVNSLAAPDAVRPVDTSAEVKAGRLDLALPPYSVLRVRLPGRP